MSPVFRSTIEDTCGFKSRRIFPSLIFIVIVSFRVLRRPFLLDLLGHREIGMRGRSQIAATSTTTSLFTLVISGKGLPATGS